MRRIAIINQKGGVGKTTTTVNLGSALARMGHRVLLIDLDPQAHLTLYLGQDPASGQACVYEMLTDSATVAKARRKVGSNLWLCPASIDLAGAEVELVSVVGREVILRDLIDQHVNSNKTPPYDYVLMDCPPSLNVLTLNALCAATEVVIPLQPHYLALQGLSKLLETVSVVGKRINPTLKVTGVVVCMNESGTRLAGEVVEDVRSFLEDARNKDVPWSTARVFGAVIRRNIKLAESPSYGKSIFDYAPDSNGAEDYLRLATELHSPNGPVATSTVVEKKCEKSQTESSPAAVSAPTNAPVEASPSGRGARTPDEPVKSEPALAADCEPPKPVSADRKTATAPVAVQPAESVPPCVKPSRTRKPKSPPAPGADPGQVMPAPADTAQQETALRSSKQACVEQAGIDPAMAELAAPQPSRTLRRRRPTAPPSAEGPKPEAQGETAGAGDSQMPPTDKMRVVRKAKTRPPAGPAQDDGNGEQTRPRPARAAVRRVPAASAEPATPPAVEPSGQPAPLPVSAQPVP